MIHYDNQQLDYYDLQGMRKNALATAKLMLADSMDTEKIKKYTDLTDSQLAELQ